MPQKTEKKELSVEISEAQLAKLKLEIKQLRKKSRWYERIASYSAAISPALALFAFIFSIYQFNKQQVNQQNTQRREQDIRIQQQIQSDTTQLLQIPKDPQATSGKAAFLLDDLKTYISLKYENTEPTAQDNFDLAISRKTMTFANSVMDDCDFTELQDVTYAFALMNYWDDFKPYLKQNPPVNQYILDRYKDALRNFHSKDAAFTSQITFDPEKKLFFHPDVEKKLDSAQIVHLQLLITSFKDAFDLIEEGELRERTVLNFQSATCNAPLTKQLLGAEVDPKDKSEFKHCFQK